MKLLKILALLLFAMNLTPASAESGDDILDLLPAIISATTSERKPQGPRVQGKLELVSYRVVWFGFVYPKIIGEFYNASNAVALNPFMRLRTIDGKVLDMAAASTVQHRLIAPGRFGCFEFIASPEGVYEPIDFDTVTPFITAEKYEFRDAPIVRFLRSRLTRYSSFGQYKARLDACIRIDGDRSIPAPALIFQARDETGEISDCNRIKLTSPFFSAGSSYDLNVATGVVFDSNYQYKVAIDGEF